MIASRFIRLCNKEEENDEEGLMALLDDGAAAMGLDVGIPTL
jgi:hypothetical protein